MKPRAAILCLAVLSLFLLSAAGQKKTPKSAKPAPLGPKYQEWLDLTTYIILPQEKEVFSKLQSDFERDIFIETFWKQRDPTPGTPENEYRQEIRKRFDYVNKEFSRDTPRPGWMTDRGRIYMILGEPQGRERISLPELHPAELWSYYGDTSKGLPTYFGLVFFRRQGIGEYTLYSPAGDGPKSLVVYMPNLGFNPDSITDVVVYIREYAPTLAPFTLSIIPQDTSLDLDPTVRSEIQMAQILESPRKNINPSYATHFMNYKGLVSTEYLTNYVECEATVAVVRDPVEGIPFLHFSVAPKSISVDYYGPDNKYFCNYAVDVSLKKGETFVFQSSKDFSYYFPADESEMVAANGVVIQDFFPVIEGKFKLTVLLRNSVGKEFSLLERDVVIDSAPSPRIGAVLVGYKTESFRDDNLMAFKVLDQRIMTDPKNSFTPTDSIALLFQLENPTEELLRSGGIKITVRGARAANPTEKEFTLPLNRPPYQRSVMFSQAIPAADLTPDYYDVTVSLVEGERIIDTESATFVVSPASKLARPIILTKTMPRTSLHLQYLALAGEAEKSGEARLAEGYFDRALRMVPDNPEAAAYYCGFLMRTRQFERALSLIETVKADPALQFDYYIIKGKALRELGRCDEAIPLLEAGNKLYNSDTRLLNALGYCYYKTGQKAQAIEALRASLRLSPDQADVKTLVEEISRQ
ncbi:MAG: hypothetical protein A2W03_08685 [Candidatus Aminicenantes bacterium RBG_16_63_16]|nr:MAG: hypothetical protein A2W03_08685 [Candidatus Aminicenantes bacterium RBG_16_63_16]